MIEKFAGCHLRFQQGAWRNDDGDPVDVVEVVRCKDCKHWGNPYCLLCKTRVGASYRSKDMAYRKPDDFCSYGKRRDE